MEEENKPSNVNATINAVAGLVEAIPVYQDTLQPAAKQIGTALETVTKTVNIVLSPIKALIWGYDKIEDYISKSVSKKLENVPPENIVTPPSSIAGPAIEALRFAGEDVNLRELYSNLLASAMDTSTQHFIHPGYVEILKNLSSDEALLLQTFTIERVYPLINISNNFLDKSGDILIMKHFSHFEYLTEFKRPELVPSYIDNICRLGLTEIPEDSYLTAPGIYDALENDKVIKYAEKLIEEQGNKLAISKKLIRLTNYGENFIKNVVIEKT